MRQLSSADLQMLTAESRTTPINVGSLAILERKRANGEDLTVDDIKGIVEERIHLLVPLRWQLVKAPLDLTLPYWIEVDPDLDYHIREVALPPPNDERALTDKAAWLTAQPMDKTRPLWEIYFFSNLPGDKVALLPKFNHAIADGMAGAAILGLLLDGDPNGRNIAPAPKLQAENQPSQMELLARAVLDFPNQAYTQFEGARKALPFLDQVPGVWSLPGIKLAGQLSRAVLGAGTTNGDEPTVFDVEPSLPVPQMSWNSEVTAKRRLELLTLSLSEVKSMKNCFDTTVNDVALAICSGGLRRWLIKYEALPDTPLLVVVPVSVRTPKQAKAFGNAISAVGIRLPTDEEDPVKRLEQCRDEMNRAKARLKVTPADLIEDTDDMLPPALLGPVTRTGLEISRAGTIDPLANLIISNVPGPRSPLYCKGALVSDMYPVSVVYDTQGLNITLFSYLDKLQIGVIADPTMVPELADLTQELRNEFNLLLAAANEAEGYRTTTESNSTPNPAMETKVRKRAAKKPAGQAHTAKKTTTKKQAAKKKASNK